MKENLQKLSNFTSPITVKLKQISRRKKWGKNSPKNKFSNIKTQKCIYKNDTKKCGAKAPHSVISVQFEALEISHFCVFRHIILNWNNWNNPLKRISRGIMNNLCAPNMCAIHKKILYVSREKKIRGNNEERFFYFINETVNLTVY